MKPVTPDYYESFKCIGDKCQNNCCIGWEIDIDRATYEFYNSIEGDFGQKLKEGIDHQTCTFRLDKNERCVFLNEKGLCNIILNLGEDALCDICHQHPRFTNICEGRLEIGLGLCCEEACRLILSRERTDFTGLTGGKMHIIDILQDRTRPLELKIELPAMTKGETLEFYRKMERLYPQWEEFLNKGEAFKGEYTLPENIKRQLAVYFMFRYGIKDMALHATAVIELLCGGMWEEPDFNNICQVSRLYSCEVEYSDVNIEELKSCFEVENEQ